MATFRELFELLGTRGVDEGRKFRTQARLLDTSPEEIEVDVVAEMLRADSGTQVFVAACLVGRLWGKRGFDASFYPLIAELASSDPRVNVRQAAISALGLAKTDAAAEKLRECLNDRDTFVVGSALRSLEGYPDSQANREALERVAAREDDDYLARLAREILAQYERRL